MSDIFISYASADRDRAKVVAETLTARGWTVWWDRVIPPGREFDEVIEEALDAARCVVVLWSKTSVASRWVKTESAEAMRRKVLIPVLIDDAKIPLKFRRLQAADLSQWQGEPDHPELLNFLQSLDTHVRDAQNPAPPQFAADRPASASFNQARDESVFRPSPPTASPPHAPIRSGVPTTVVIAVGALVAIVVGVIAYSALRNQVNPDVLVAPQPAPQLASQPAPQPTLQPAPQAQPQTPPSPINIGGVWRDATGGVHQIRQAGSQFEVITANPSTGYASQGAGTVNGRQVTTNFQTNLPSTGRAVGTLATDGQSISGTVADSRLGQYGLMIYR